MTDDVTTSDVEPESPKVLLAVNVLKAAIVKRELYRDELKAEYGARSLAVMRMVADRELEALEADGLPAPRSVRDAETAICNAMIDGIAHPMTPEERAEIDALYTEEDPEGA